jgi:pyruvate dehydrogenase complex dehydrogenase (E1) component
MPPRTPRATAATATATATTVQTAATLTNVINCLPIYNVTRTDQDGMQMGGPIAQFHGMATMAMRASLTQEGRPEGSLDLDLQAHQSPGFHRIAKAVEVASRNTRFR